MDRLLVVEDDRELNQGLCKALRADGFVVFSSLNMKDARQQLLLGGIALVLLDVNLPDGSGIELLGSIKQATPEVSVILLTANDTDIDIVEGLERGADDYITKPFSLSVLRARIHTQLRKAALPAKTGQKICIGHFSFDFQNMQFLVGEDSVELSKTEQKLLRILVENQGCTVSRGDLIDRIWTDGAEYVDENALSVTVNRLRNKLGAQNDIRTIYGIGYSWGKG
ncbi:MAG: response regulator transcription factor [Lachnospiraceae bacterium]|nr:response regulator transcription factor [Lachnospiraceae bacterium]MDE7028366.1 response regulator transcription factor [Lachnospiraceae bacterium]